MTVERAYECPLNYDGKCRHSYARGTQLADHNACMEAEPPLLCPLRYSHVHVELDSARAVAQLGGTP